MPFPALHFWGEIYRIMKIIKRHKNTQKATHFKILNIYNIYISIYIFIYIYICINVNIIAVSGYF